MYKDTYKKLNEIQRKNEEALENAEWSIRWQRTTGQCLQAPREGGVGMHMWYTGRPGADRHHTFSDTQEFQNYAFQVKQKQTHTKKYLRSKEREK